MLTVDTNILLRYALNPDSGGPGLWRGGCGVIREVELLAPGGSLHVVDFGDMGGLPFPARLILRSWLAHFHVTPRLELAEFAAQIAARRQLRCRARRRHLGYYQMIRVLRPTSPAD